MAKKIEKTSQKKDNKAGRDEKSAAEFIHLSLGSHDGGPHNPGPHRGRWMENAKRLNEWFNGRYNTLKDGTRNIDKFTKNSVFELVSLLLPNFIFQSPHIKATPQNAVYYKELVDGKMLQIDNNKAALTREAAINHCYQKIKGIDEDRKATQDAFFYGFGITKTGYSFETVSSDDKDYKLEDQYFHKRVNPKDFGWHPMATDVSDSIKLVHRVMMTKTSIKKRYPEVKLEDICVDVPQHVKDRVKNKTAYKDHVTLYEVHDQENSEIYTFAGSDQLLIDKRKDIYNIGPHFSMLKFSGENDEFVGIPFMLMVEDECKALNEIMTLIVQHFRKFTGQIFYNHGALDEDDKERIINGEQGSLHGVNDVNQMKPQPPLQMGAEYFNIVQLLQNQMERTLGIPDFQRMSGSSRKSATEASYIQGDATVRRAYYLSIVKDFVLDGVKKVAKLQAKFQDAKEEFKAGAENGYQHIAYDKTDISGDWQFDFDIDNLAYINEAEFNQIVNMLNVLGAHEMLHPILRVMDPMKTGKQLFKRVNLNLESFVSGAIEEAIVFTPEKENEMAEKGKLMPRPTKGENYEWHLSIHKKFVTDKIDAVGPEQAQKMPAIQQIIEHMAETEMLKAQASGAVSQGSPPAGQIQAPQQGPQGPMQQPEAPMQTSPEAAPPPPTMQ